MSNIDVPLDPAEDEPSLLNEFTHAEFQRVYEDASANIRFAKQQQWHTIVYFSAGAIAAVAYGHVTAWSDQQLIFYLMLLIWFLSLISALVVLSLQWWQGAEHRKIDYIASKWSCFVNAARARKSPRLSDIQRYGMFLSMLFYLELVTIAATRIFWPQI